MLGFASVFGYLLFHSTDSKVARVVFGTLVAFTFIRDLVSHFRGTNVTLKVTNLDLISTGHAPDGYSPSSIPRASLYKLEFRESWEGGDAPQPSGLYIEHHGILHDPVTCALPHIDSAQTHQVIEAILHRFPDTEQLAPPKALDPSDLISLNLNK